MVSDEVPGVLITIPVEEASDDYVIEARFRGTGGMAVCWKASRSYGRGVRFWERGDSRYISGNDRDNLMYWGWSDIVRVAMEQGWELYRCQIRPWPHEVNEATESIERLLNMWSNSPETQVFLSVRYPGLAHALDGLKTAVERE